MSTRKRIISSCIPCYTRKQKCNREFPCNHCVRRQCIADCVYHSYNSTSATQTATPTVQVLLDSRAEDRPREKAKLGSIRSSSLRNEWNAYVKSVPSAAAPWSGPSLAESFGYFEGSSSNTFALIQKFGIASPDISSTRSPTLIPEAADEVHRSMERMPDRQILDFLVQFFVTEINWMDQLVHIPWFLPKYRALWLVERVTLVAEVDFIILVLRICSYALQFLPSPGYTLDKIRGMLLADVRTLCDEAADSLEAISTAADSRGSLFRVQHLAYYGLQCRAEGKTNASWEALSRAIRVAQNVGMHCDAATSRVSGESADREIERMTFCNLYIYDSLFSRQLDRLPFLPTTLSPGKRPQLHILRSASARGPDSDSSLEPGTDAPDPFTERLLEIDLANFWRTAGPVQDTDEYDMVAAEERYERFCREYVSQLPPAFALANPDETWDKRIPKLPLQRKLLHMTIYESMCWNFRPLLLRRPAPLPAYKSFMLSWQKRKLASAALHVLDNVAQLHALLGDCHTRLVGIVFLTFEAAVLLVSLCTDPTFPEVCPQQHVPPRGAPVFKADPLQAGLCRVTLQGCLSAVKDALKRLRMLAAVSNMADVGANTLTQLLSKASELSARMETAADEAVAVADDAAAAATVMPIQNAENPDVPPLASIAAAATAAPLVRRATAPTLTTVTTTQPATTTHAIVEPTSAATRDMTSWLPGDLSDMRSTISDFTSISSAPTLADNMATWPAFDASSVFTQDAYMDYWARQAADSA